jgi:hypothetical protein
MPEYESSESDVDESISSATQNNDNNTVTQDQADKQKASDDDSSSDDDNDITTRTSSRQKHTPVTFKARPEKIPTPMSHSNILKYIKGTQQHKDYHENQKALYSAYHTAVSTTIAPSDNVPENYKNARAIPDVADWTKACDVEMGKLRSLGCWEVISRSTLPPNASIIKKKSRWTFRYKTNELGNLKSVSHRSRFVAKGYSQVQGLHYFENYAPVASFTTLRLLFALTSIPNFQVLQKDVSVAFIQSKLDSNHLPVYCECAEGYEDRRKYVYRLHRHLYVMKDSPRGWGQLFSNVCTDFGLKLLKSDECVFVKFVNNSKTRIQSVLSNLTNIIEATALVPENAESIRTVRMLQR